MNETPYQWARLGQIKYATKTGRKSHGATATVTLEAVN
jgi:hypothetical protein